MNNRSNVVDAYVGARLRMRRLMMGLSQSKLGEELGVTFQQIQKYEKGTNRISAARLRQAAQVLDTTIQFFLEGAPTEASNPRPLRESSSPSFDVTFLASSEGLQLNRAFLRIRNPRIRRRIVDLVVSLAEPEVDGELFVKTNELSELA